MSEQAFWKRFLASEFFHRSRTGGRSQLTPYDDIFDRCLQEEDDGMWEMQEPAQTSNF